MKKIITEGNQEKHFFLDHKEISLEVAGVNQSKSEADRFLSQMGHYNEEKDCWIFPSPIDAINVFQSL